MEKDTLLQQIFYKLGSIEKKLDDLNGSVKAHDDKIDVLEVDCSKLQEAFKPIKKTYNKMTDFSFGIIILVGSVIGGFIYFLWDKIKT